MMFNNDDGDDDDGGGGGDGICECVCVFLSDCGCVQCIMHINRLNIIP